MTQFSSKFKKTLFLAGFWPIFPILGAQKNFPGKLGSVMQNFIWVSSTMPKFRKVNDKIQKHLDRQTEGRKDRQTLFYRTFPATARGPKTPSMTQLTLMKCSLVSALVTAQQMQFLFLDSFQRSISQNTGNCIYGICQLGKGLWYIASKGTVVGSSYCWCTGMVC